MRRSLLALAIGTFALAVMLEIFLRVVGSNPSENPQRVTGDYDFVCIGNSHTAGVLDVSGRSYCEQLGEIMWVGERRAKGLNLGRINADTWRLKTVLRLHAASLRNRDVFLMVGEANQWNTMPRQKSAGADATNSSWRPKLFNFWDLLSRLLTGDAQFARFGQSTVFEGLPRDSDAVRLKWLGLGVETGGIRRLLLDENGRMSEASMAEAREAIQSFLGDPKRRAMAQIGLFELGDPLPSGIDWQDPAWSHLVGYLIQRGRAPQELRAAISPELYLRIARIMKFRGIPVTSARAELANLRAGDDVFLEKYCGFDPLCLSRAYVLRQRENSSIRPIEMLRLGIALNPYPAKSWPEVANWIEQSPGTARAIEDVRKELANLGVEVDQGSDIKEWIKRDTHEMLRITREAGGRPYLHGYPISPEGSVRRIDSILKEVSLEANTEFIDSAGYLKAAARSLNMPISKLFLEVNGETDAHLNIYGNELMARRLCHWYQQRNPNVYTCR